MGTVAVTGPQLKIHKQPISLFEWFLSWLRQGASPTRERRPVTRQREHSRSSLGPAASAAPRELESRGAGRSELAPREPQQRKAEASALPRLVTKPSIVCLDLVNQRTLAVSGAEQALLERIAQRVESGKFELPQLPATSMALVNLAGKPGVDVSRLVDLISSDPSLASELLRTANSVLYAAHVPAETLNQAVMRIGLRGLRSLIFSVSVKGTILRLGKLQTFSEEIWRQAHSVASISRDIAPLVGQEKDRAFLIGLLHDVGKIALLSILAQEASDSELVTPAAVGRVFFVHHERAGALLAEKWRLSEELISVAGNHHRFQENLEFGQSAALASLAHKLDLHLTQDDEEAFLALLSCEELEFLGVSPERRRAVLEKARRTFELGPLLGEPAAESEPHAA
jgi:putative nucleotidyltransferase with HDIG domain